MILLKKMNKEQIELLQLEQMFLMEQKKRVFVRQKVSGEFGIEIYTINPNKEEVNGKPWVKMEGIWHLGFLDYFEALKEGINIAKSHD